MAQSANLKDTPAVTGEPSVKDLSAQVEVLKSDIGRLTETIASLGKAQGRHLAEDARDRADRARGMAEEKGRELRAGLEVRAREAEDYVRENPASALGIAAGFGFLVGYLTSRR